MVFNGANEIVMQISLGFYTLTVLVHHKPADRVSFETRLFELIFLVGGLIWLTFTFSLTLKFNSTTREDVRFIYKDSMRVQTDSYNFYLGETSTHLIMYDTISDEATIYKKENIDHIRYGKNKRY